MPFRSAWRAAHRMAAAGIGRRLADASRRRAARDDSTSAAFRASIKRPFRPQRSAMLRRSTPLRPALSCNNSSTNMPVNPLQLNAHGELKHLLTLEGLPRESITHILDTARQLIDARGGGIKKSPLLRGKSVFNLFFEHST